MTVTVEDAKKEVSTARFAPLAITVAAGLLCGAVVWMSEKNQVRLSLVLPVMGVLWIGGFSISLRAVKLAGMILALLDDRE